jgi:hypothetical protein
MKTIKSTRAISTEIIATPEKPNNAAIIAKTKNVITIFNITVLHTLKNKKIYIPQNYLKWIQKNKKLLTITKCLYIRLF